MFNIDHKFDFGAVASKLSVMCVCVCVLVLVLVYNTLTDTHTQKSNRKLKIIHNNIK